jgi:hypothetical protein
MNLKRYIEGLRKGRDVNCLERKAMEDPFLADALEGYDQVKGDHSLRIEEMIKQVTLQTQPKNKVFHTWGVAAVILVLIAFGGYLLFDEFSFSIRDYIPQKEKRQALISHSKPEKKEVAEKDSTLFFTPFKTSGSADFPIFDTLLMCIIPEDSLKGDNKPDSIAENENNSDKEENEKQQNEPLSPEPAVGYGSYYKYLKTQLIPPADEECNKIKGKVVLSFSINGNGRPEEITVTQSLCPSADAEAIRLVKEGPGWTAGETDVTLVVRF